MVPDQGRQASDISKDFVGKDRSGAGRQKEDRYGKEKEGFQNTILPRKTELLTS